MYSNVFCVFMLLFGPVIRNENIIIIDNVCIAPILNNFTLGAYIKKKNTYMHNYIKHII